MDDIERRTLRKVWWRIVPFLTVALFFNYLDKVNIGFAALTMNEDLGFSNTIFGAGAGFFALGYALFGIPSTLLLHRLGARRWICTIMVAWGLCSAATAFVTTPEDLFAIRFLLGVAEAGFLPGVILYFSYWIPSAYRGRILGSFLIIAPLGLAIGGPASSALLGLDGVHGLAGWQWLFLVEALPTLLLAPVALFCLRDSPSKSGFLSSAEKEWLAHRITLEHEAVGPSPVSAWQALRDGRVWKLALFNLGMSTSGIGPVLFLPLIVQSAGFSIGSTGLLVALPGIAAALTLRIWGVWADKSASREVVVATACGTIAAGLICSSALAPSTWSLLPLSLAMVGFYGCLVAFWTLPSALLTGDAAAAGMAFINIAGNLGAFVGPYLLGWLSDQTQSYVSGLTSLGLIATVSSVLLVLRRSNSQELAATRAITSGK